MEAAKEGVPLPVPFGGFVGELFSFSDGRHRFVYTRDYTNDKTIPIAMYKTDAARGIMGGVGNNARLLWYDPTSASISNPPAQNVKWSVKYYDNQTIEELTDPKKHSTMELMGNPLPLPHYVDFYPNVLHSEVFLRVEIQPLKAFDRQVDNQELKLKEWIKSLRAFDGRKQLFGYVDFAVGIPEKRGEGLGQAAYLKAAQELSKYGIPLLSTNSSAKADRAWESLERNLPPGFKIATMTNWEEARTNPRFKDKITKIIWYKRMGERTGAILQVRKVI